ncbi:MAG TPA: type II secretion system F family protein [Mycobacteriales bacterium]|jgi:tight adherence protein B|nr:type II secretion system F family protein [Mycobacteriales bacterium]
MTALVSALAAAVALAAWPPSSRVHRLRAARRDATSMRVPHVLAVVVLVQLAALLLGAALPAAAGVLAVVVSAPLLRRRAEGRLRARRRDASVDVVFSLAAELRAGRTPAQALVGAAQATEVLRVPLTGAATAVRAGAPAAEPLHVVSQLDGCEVLAAVGAVWRVTEQAGGAVADVLERLGMALDADAADRRAFEAALAGPRASMTLLAGLPALGLGMGQSVGAHPLRLLLHRPVGWALLAGAVLLEIAGVAWSRRLVRAVVPP